MWLAWIGNKLKLNIPWGTLGARGFSCTVSGFCQVLKSDQCEKPLDQRPVADKAPRRTLSHTKYEGVFKLAWISSNYFESLLLPQ